MPSRGGFAGRLSPHVRHRGHRPARRACARRRRRRPHGGDAPPPGPRRLGALLRGPDRVRPPPALDHRPRGRPAADGHRRGGDRVQRRGVQLRRAARRALGPRPHVRDGVGHGGDPPRVARVGPGLRAAAQRDVRLRALRPGAARGPLRARPLRREAPLPARRRRAGALRVGGEGPPGERRRAGRGRARRPPRVPHLPARARRADALPRRHPGAPGRVSALGRSRPARAAASATGTRASESTSRATRAPTPGSSRRSSATRCGSRCARTCPSAPTSAAGRTRAW